MEELRPPVAAQMSHIEFSRWYWSVESLHMFCELLGLSRSGTKSQLRERIAAKLGGTEAGASETPKRKPKSSFNWAKEPLEATTIITDSVSFGPNLRGWLKKQIGPRFVCHSDFMAWIKSNEGATLADAIEAWHEIERERSQPGFRREIALCNNYLRYLRAIRDDYPDMSQEDAMRCWQKKKLRPAQDGFVIYERNDLRFIEQAK